MMVADPRHLNLVSTRRYGATWMLSTRSSSGVCSFGTMGMRFFSTSRAGADVMADNGKDFKSIVCSRYHGSYVF